VEALAEPKPLPGRGVLDDRGLHGLTNNDVFWDQIAEITSVGEQDVYEVAVAGTHNVAQGVSVAAPNRAEGRPSDTN
jgi:hypothetical protein